MVVPAGSDDRVGGAKGVSEAANAGAVRSYGEGGDQAEAAGSPSSGEPLSLAGVFVQWISPGQLSVSPTSAVT